MGIKAFERRFRGSRSIGVKNRLQNRFVGICGGLTPGNKSAEFRFVKFVEAV